MSLVDDNGHYTPAPYVLSISCVSGDEVQVAVHRYKDVFWWLQKLDHEGSTWEVVEHTWNPRTNTIEDTHDLTDMVREEYEQ